MEAQKFVHTTATKTFRGGSVFLVYLASVYRSYIHLWLTAISNQDTQYFQFFIQVSDFFVNPYSKESFEMWCWRRMEKISWTDHVRNEDVLLKVNEQRNILHEIRKRKANWIGHILRRNCLLKQVIEGKIKGEMKVTRRRKNLLNDLNDWKGYSHLK